MAYKIWVTALIIGILIQLIIACWHKRKNISKQKTDYLFSIVFTGIMLIGTIIIFITAETTITSVIGIIFFIEGIVIVVKSKKKLNKDK